MKRYIVVGIARSGTTVTHLCLKGHPNVSALNDEVKVNKFFALGLSCFTHGFNLPEENQRAHLAIFDTITTLCADKDISANGMKVAVSSPQDANIFVKAVKMYFKNAYIIFTLRNDFVAQYGSMKLALKTGQYHSWREKNNYVKGKIRLNKYLYIKYLLDCLDIVATIRKLEETHEFLEFTYEVDISAGNWFKLFDFLRIERVDDIHWLTSKKVAPVPSEYIENYNQLTRLSERIRKRHCAGYPLGIYEMNRNAVELLKIVKNRAITFMKILKG
jgi:hypothetical protein